jgi:hypothetical protein
LIFTFSYSQVIKEESYIITTTSPTPNTNGKITETRDTNSNQQPVTQKVNNTASASNSQNQSGIIEVPDQNSSQTNSNVTIIEQKVTPENKPDLKQITEQKSVLNPK